MNTNTNNSLEGQAEKRAKESQIVNVQFTEHGFTELLAYLYYARELMEQRHSSRESEIADFISDLETIRVREVMA